RHLPAPDSASDGRPVPGVHADVPRPPDRPAATVAAAGSGATPDRPASAKPRKRRRGSARFAGLDDEPTASPAPPGAPQAAAGLRGARFAGAEAEAGGTRDDQHAEPVPDADDHRAVAQAVTTLAALRSTGRTGEAHILLVEAAHWPAVRFPLLAVALARAGLGADWATFRWEAAALPPGQLASAAAALKASGHAREGDRLLREGVARPPEETGAAVARLDTEGRHGAARALLDAGVRTRTPEDAARIAAGDPDRLAPLLLEAARHVSEDHHRDLVYALRAAGITL
ncbi:hypothetical protein ACFWN1_21175, partial [Streptomyces sp. NPDC058459]